MATKDPKIKNVVVSDNDQKYDEKEEGIKKAVVASDDSPIVEKDKKDKETAKNNDVASDDNRITVKNKKEIDLGISLDKLSLGPKKKLLVLPLGGFLVHRAHRRRPNTIPKKRRADFSSGNFMRK